LRTSWLIVGIKEFSLFTWLSERAEEHVRADPSGRETGSHFP